MRTSDVTLAVFALILSLVATVLVAAGSVFYFRRVRMERPPIGTFNRRDMVILFVTLCTLPLIYLRLPRIALTVILAVTLASALSIGLRSLLSPTRTWLVIGGLLGANIWI